MTIKQSRYITAETEAQKKVRVTEVQKIDEDPYIRRSEVQQEINNSTLPVSSRAVKIAIESINSDLDLKADKTELEGLATEVYVNEKIDEKEIGITEPELISKSVGSGKWMREGAYGFGGLEMPVIRVGDAIDRNGLYRMFGSFGHFNYGPALNLQYDKVHSTLFGVRSVTKEVPEFIAVHDNAKGDPVKVDFLTSGNTFPDSNGVLHNSRNPIDTLNVSDMADTVVDNDLLTVTSGAVFRVIKQLTDQIISLETRVRELEDGGI